MSAPTERNIKVTVMPCAGCKLVLVQWRRTPTHPCHISGRLAEFFSDLRNRETDGEEVEGVPRPTKESNSEHQPLVQVELFEHRNRRAKFVLLHKSIRNPVKATSQWLGILAEV